MSVHPLGIQPYGNFLFNGGRDIRNAGKSIFATFINIHTHVDYSAYPPPPSYIHFVYNSYIPYPIKCNQVLLITYTVDALQNNQHDSDVLTRSDVYRARSAGCSER